MKNFASEDNTIQYSYSEIGKHHVDTESGNQDSVFIGKVCDNTYCMVVSDGVSSCKYAKAGSEATIETIKSLATKLHLGEMTIVNLDEIKRFIVGKGDLKRNGTNTELRLTSLLYGIVKH